MALLMMLLLVLSTNDNYFNTRISALRWPSDDEEEIDTFNGLESE